MKSTRTRRAFGAVFALSLVAAACGSDDDDSSDSGTVAEGTEASTADTAAESTDTAAEDTTAEPTDDTAAEGTDDSTAPAGDGVRLGIMAECEGAFGGFNEDVVAGATLALINEAGATPNSTGHRARRLHRRRGERRPDRTGRDRLR